MEEFLAYLNLGFHHIVDPKACDHLLFVITLCAAYAPQAWRQILVLITAFTVGHSLTLALSALNIVRISSELVEMLIPITILLTSLYNLVAKPNSTDPAFSRPALARYLLALGFGLIHGLGFSNFFRGLMGDEGSIIWPLFSFNVGIEMGQLMIIAAFFALFALLRRWGSIEQRDWTLFVSGMGAGGAALIILGLF
jgi:HupE / UreJ protein